MTWSNKEREPASIDRGRILATADDQVLVGSSEDLVLIFQEETDFWSYKSRNED